MPIQTDQYCMLENKLHFARNSMMMIAGTIFLLAGFIMSLLFLTVTIILVPVVGFRLWWRQLTHQKKPIITSSTDTILDVEYTEADK